MAATSLGKAPWQAQGEEKRKAVRRLFADVAPRYDFMNALMSLALHRRWRAFAVSRLALQEGDPALDVCCGTGDFLIPLRRAVGERGLLTGADFCEPMLGIARRKAPDSELVVADAASLPFADDSFQAVTVGWGLRNLADLDSGLAEIARCLKPGGTLVSVDMAMPRNGLVRRLSLAICNGLLPRIGALFGLSEAYAYLPKSAERFASRDKLRQRFEAAGFRDVEWRDMMFGNICVMWGTKR
jgi:demethylmenaquinone methyltransferase/2-methoxy-6-polyprenyl-1,4-benzoquinol methylase